MRKEMKVLHLMTGFGGGISSFIKNKATYFASDPDVVFDVLTFDEVSEEFKQAITDTGGKVHRVIDPKINLLRFIKESFLVFRQQPKDVVVHSHFGMNLAIVFYVMTKLCGINRFAVHAHTDAPEKVVQSFGNKYKRFFNGLMASDRLSCGTGASRNVFGEKFVEKNQIVHVPNSIKPEDFMGNSIAKDLKKQLNKTANEEMILIGHIGRFHPQKNHWGMITLIEELSRKTTNFRWLLIGEGELLNEIKTEVDRRGLTKYVVFLGRRNDIPEILNLLDVFVLPSLYEGLPTVAVEAQAASVPSLLATTITKEVDLGMGLVRFLELDDLDSWVDVIMKVKQQEAVPAEIRLEKLTEHKFTNEASAKLYKDFLEGKLSYYNI